MRMSNKTRQELQAWFNKMVRGISKQGALAYDCDTQMCRYRTEDGRRCFVGQLIPKKKYDPEMEGEGAHSVCIRKVLGGFRRDSLKSNFLQSMQDAHDSSADSRKKDAALVRECLLKAVTVGEHFGLETKVCLKELDKA